MGKIRTIALSSAEHQALETGYRTSDSHAFRKRCQLVLLKHEGRTSLDVGLATGMGQLSANSWLGRYGSEGIAGLHTKAGRRRKPILDQREDKERVCRAVKEERQRLGQAKALPGAELGKQFSGKTPRRFLKSLAAATNGQEGGLRANATGKLYAVRKEALGLPEGQSRQGLIDLLYGEEAGCRKKAMCLTAGSLRMGASI